MTDRLRRKKQQAFTLFELLLVMTIVAIMVSAVVLTLNPDNSHRELEQEAKRLTEVLRQLGDEAVFQGQELGVVFQENHYQFAAWNRKDERWLPMDTDPVFRPYTLPEPVLLVLTAEEVPYSLAKQDDAALEETENLVNDSVTEQGINDKTDDTPQSVPSAWFLSSGEITPFVLELFTENDPGRRYKITVSAMGDIVLEMPDAPHG